MRHVSDATLGRLLARPAPPSHGARRLHDPRGHLAAPRHLDPHLRQVERCRPRRGELDLVAHCHSSTKGFDLLCTLSTVDIATTRVEVEAILGKGHDRGGGVHRMRQRLPMPQQTGGSSTRGT
jgi:hypothetical protein